MTGAPVVDLEPRHKPWLDGWRGIAILAVLVGHFLMVPDKPARFGVELFFVLSGRLMGELLFVNQQPLGYFLKRRVARVWPALYVFVFVMAVVFAAPGPSQVNLGQIAGALTFTFNYVRIFGGPLPVFDHLWSLCVEEWTYVFLALVALVAKGSARRATIIVLVTAAICALNGIAQTIAGGEYRDVYWRTDVRAASILVSCGLYLILRNRSIPSYVPIVAGIAGSILQTQFFPDMVKYTVGTSLLAVSVVTIDSAPRFAISILSSRFVTMAGLWSFSMYIWQQPFAKVMDAPLPIKFGLMLAAALTSYYVVERPARRYLKRVWANTPKAKEPVPAMAAEPAPSTSLPA